MESAATRAGSEDEDRIAVLIIRARLAAAAGGRVPDAAWAKVSWLVDLNDSAPEVIRHAATRERVSALVREWLDAIGAPEEGSDDRNRTGAADASRESGS